MVRIFLLIPPSYTLPLPSHQDLQWTRLTLLMIPRTFQLLSMMRKIFPPHTIALKPSSYYEFEEYQNINAAPYFYSNFSMLSFNIRSLHGKYEEFKDFLSDIKHRFSIICWQEIWSVSREYPLEGYQSIEFNTRDAHLSTPNRNCGGGVSESTLESICLLQNWFF